MPDLSFPRAILGQRFREAPSANGIRKSLLASSHREVVRSPYSRSNARTEEVVVELLQGVLVGVDSVKAGDDLAMLKGEGVQSQVAKSMRLDQVAVVLRGLRAVRAAVGVAGRKVK